MKDDVLKLIISKEVLEMKECFFLIEEYIFEKKNKAVKINLLAGYDTAKTDQVHLRIIYQHQLTLFQLAFQSALNHFIIKFAEK